MLHVALGRPLVPDRQPQDVAAVELRVRDEDLAARVDPLEDRLVLLVRAFAAEADERELSRRAKLPAGLVAHPALEQLGEPDRLPDPRLEPFAPVAAQHGPELERAEAPPEGRPVLAEVERALVGRAQELGDERERFAELGGTARPEQRAVHRREHPLVGVDDERVGTLDALEGPAQLRAHHRRAGVRGVDVQPRAGCARSARRLPRTGSTEAVEVVPTVATTAATSSSGERVRQHPEPLVGRRLAQLHARASGPPCRPPSARARSRRRRCGRWCGARRSARRASRSRRCPRCARASRAEDRAAGRPSRRRAARARSTPAPSARGSRPSSASRRAAPRGCPARRPRPRSRRRSADAASA